jgi:MFS superfamily sulfate permease-like transporter
MTPSDIYTLLIAIIVGLVLTIAWLLDRIAAAIREVDEAKQDAKFWKKQASKTFTEHQAQVWGTRA